MHTIHSRLKVLIARAFRAEKLYASMRKHEQGGEAASASLLIDLANEIRAREWQRAHTKLRKVLNEILERSSATELSSEIVRLHKHFSLKAEESSSLLTAALGEIPDMSRRQEFSAMLKLSAELVRYKARYQAYQALADELASVIDSGDRNDDWSQERQLVGESISADEELFSTPSAEVVNGSEIKTVEMVTTPVSGKTRNVIPLRRR